MLNDRDYMHPSAGYGRTGQDRSVLKVLIWVNAIVFLLSGFGNNTTLISLLMLHSELIRELQLWRLGTYMFAHASFSHILFNMWGLYIFGAPLERRLGGTRFLNLYFMSGMVGGVVWLLTNWHSRFPVIGASGAVFGVMMAAAMTYPDQVIVLLFPPIPMRLKTFVAVYGGIEVVMALSAGGGRIAHIAHLGGILGGFLYMRRLAGPASGQGSGRRSILWRWRQFLAGRKRRGFDVTGESADDADTRGSDERMSAEVDRILDKIGESGLSSLTAEERRTLDHIRDRLRKR